MDPMSSWVSIGLEVPVNDGERLSVVITLLLVGGVESRDNEVWTCLQELLR